MGAVGKSADGEAGLWLRWVVANAVGEGIGLGGAVLIGAAGARNFGGDAGLFRLSYWRRSRSSPEP